MYRSSWKLIPLVLRRPPANRRLRPQRRPKGGRWFPLAQPRPLPPPHLPLRIRSRRVTSSSVHAAPRHLCSRGLPTHKVGSPALGRPRARFPRLLPSLTQFWSLPRATRHEGSRNWLQLPRWTLSGMGKRQWVGELE